MCHAYNDKRKKEKLHKEKNNPIRTPGEKFKFKYLGIYEVDTIKATEMEAKIRKEYLKIIRKHLETKFWNLSIMTNGIYLISPRKWNVKYSLGHWNTNGSSTPNWKTKPSFS